MSYQGVLKISNVEAYCKHCNTLIKPAIWDFNDERNDIDYQIRCHIKLFTHTENYFDYMAYNHAVVDYVNG